MRHSNRFKTKEAQEHHTAKAHEWNARMDENNKAEIEDRFDVEVRILTTNTLRITDGKKRLDLYATKYFKVEENKRGSYSYFDRDKLISEYFGIEKKK